MGEDLHRLEIEPVDRWAVHAADRLAAEIGESITTRGRCLLALSGGSTPGPVLAELARRPLDWGMVTILQVDDRLAPMTDPRRNLAGIKAAFEGLPVSWLPLPVDRLLDGGRPNTADDPPPPAAELDVALGALTSRLVELADDPPVIDVAQLGLGEDGHTASLVPGDPVVQELRRYVALTGPYQGLRRLTLTRPVFDRAHCVIWLVRGQSKAEPLGRLLAGDLSIPAGLIRPRRSLIVADADAARQA